MPNLKENTAKVDINTPDQYKKIILNNIRHDLTNPINAILGYSELIIEVASEQDDDDLIKDIQSIYDSGKAVLESINIIFSTDSIDNQNNIGEIIHNPEIQYSLRTPLSTIIGLSELVLDDLTTKLYKNVEDIIESMEKIALAGKRLFKLLNNLKNYSDLNVEELMEKYNPDIYSKEASLRLFEFNAKVKIQEQIGTILIIDDEISNLDLLAKILHQSHQTVFKAENAAKAIVILSKKSAQIDLILLDLIMPGMNGIELLQKIKADEDTYHIPVIMLSALDETDTIVECVNLGANDFLLKPVNQVLLKAKINNALEKKHFRDKEIQYQEKIKEEQEKSETLLLNILPRSIAQRLKDGETPIADDIDSATVLFADLSEFTTLSSSISAKDLVMLLNKVFSVFDQLLVKHSLEKIKTIGDSYMLAGGIPNPIKNHAMSVAEMALDMLEILPKINKETNSSLQIRIGINSGPVSAGVIGTKKFIYDLWGDTVNVANRMESYGKKNHIHISDTTYKLLKDFYQFEKRDKLDIDGKGSMQTYFLSHRL